LVLWQDGVVLSPLDTITIRSAVVQDVRAIRALCEPYVEDGYLVAKPPVSYYESVPDFCVAETGDGAVVGCGAVHVMWEDLGEIRTLAAASGVRGHGVGHRILEALIARGRELGLQRLFCLTFQVGFFARHGFKPILGTPVSQEIYGELLRSHDDGVAEFLDLARVKPNTLGNTRMLLTL
jgi:amino-acid N-acetyltransferase